MNLCDVVVKPIETGLRNKGLALYATLRLMSII